MCVFTRVRIVRSNNQCSVFTPELAQMVFVE